MLLLGTGKHEVMVNRANLKLASSSTAEVPGNMISSVTYRKSYLSEELLA